MLSKRYVSLFFFVLFSSLLTLAIPAKADVLVERDSTIFGRITQITGSDFIVARGCDDSNLRTIPKNRVRYFQRDDSCQPHDFVLPTSPFQICAQPKQQMYKVFFKQQESEVYATDLILGNDMIIRLQLAKNLGSLQAPMERITSIMPALVCPTAIPDSFTGPKEFCHEPPHMAVNFSLKPVYNNKIFTRGFTFYLDVIGGHASDQYVREVSRAFGAALTLWASKLLALRPRLDPELAAFVDSALARSSRFTLFTPPQVVQVACRENALMIVKLFNVRENNLFPQNSGYVAKAQLEGRTILLNGIDFQFRTDLDTRNFFKDNRANLVSIFAHELGHSFGLPDIGSNTQISIMNVDNIVDNSATSPTDTDGVAFVDILRRSITGSGPGEFKAKECAGLRIHKKKN